MGTVKGLRAILNYFLERYGNDDTLDDQMIVNKHCEDSFFKQLVALDHENEVFGYCGSTAPLEVRELNYKISEEDGQVRHKISGTRPCFLVSVGGIDMNVLTMPLFQFKSYRWMGYLLEKFRYDPRCIENVIRSHLKKSQKD